MNKYQEAYSYIKHYCELDDDFLKWPLAERSIKAFKELVDRATPKKRVFVKATSSISAHDECPVCRAKVSPIRLYCDNCGQRLE